MWNNGRSGEFTGPMGHESIVKYTTIAKVKALGIDEDSPLFHTMVKLMSRLDELEERKFGTPIASSPHAAHISESAQLLVNLNMRGCFAIILINVAGNPSWSLWRLKPIGPI